MTMKRAELEKRLGRKIANDLRQVGKRFDTSASPVGRREQRERDRAAGLVPFAVKLPGDLVRQLQEIAMQHQQPLNKLVDELLRRALTATEDRG